MSSSSETFTRIPTSPVLPQSPTPTEKEVSGPKSGPETGIEITLPSQAHASSSIFSRADSTPIHNVPMSVIHRPLPSELDEDKVLRFMQEMEDGDTFTPIEIVKVRAKLKTNPTGPIENFYFSMGGCHRYEAVKRLGRETIRAKIIEVPPAQMRIYLGAGSPF